VLVGWGGGGGRPGGGGAARRPDGFRAVQLLRSEH
jgi:hypothetical protein